MEFLFKFKEEQRRGCCLPLSGCPLLFQDLTEVRVSSSMNTTLFLFCQPSHSYWVISCQGTGSLSSFIFVSYLEVANKGLQPEQPTHVLYLVLLSHALLFLKFGQVSSIFNRGHFTWKTSIFL